MRWQTKYKCLSFYIGNIHTYVQLVLLFWCDYFYRFYKKTPCSLPKTKAKPFLSIFFQTRCLKSNIIHVFCNLDFGVWIVSPSCAGIQQNIFAPQLVRNAWSITMYFKVAGTMYWPTHTVETRWQNLANLVGRRNI